MDLKDFREGVEQLVTQEQRRADARNVLMEAELKLLDEVFAVALLALPYLSEPLIRKYAHVPPNVPEFERGTKRVFLLWDEFARDADDKLGGHRIYLWAPGVDDVLVGNSPMVRVYRQVRTGRIDGDVTRWTGLPLEYLTYEQLLEELTLERIVQQIGAAVERQLRGNSERRIQEVLDKAHALTAVATLVSKLNR